MKKTLKLTLIFGCLAALSACSSSKTSNSGAENAEEMPAVIDAATDPVPQPAPESAQAAPTENNQQGIDPTLDPVTGLPVTDVVANAAPVQPQDPANPVDAVQPQDPANPADPAAQVPDPFAATPPAPANDLAQAPVSLPEPAQAPAAEPQRETASAHAPIHEAAPADASIPGDGQYQDYTVQAGDTLMKIAFETYGDLFQWKAILEANKDKVSDPNHIPAGTVLRLEKPAVQVVVERNGERYLIKTGDTLGSISGEVYGTQSKWRKLWENNRQLIRDPNRIYAGFYLYYQPDASVTPSPLAGQQQPAAAPVGTEVSRAPASTASPAQPQ